MDTSLLICQFIDGLTAETGLTIQILLWDGRIFYHRFHQTKEHPRHNECISHANGFTQYDVGSWIYCLLIKYRENCPNNDALVAFKCIA